jgi:hypothetical protein
MNRLNMWTPRFWRLVELDAGQPLPLGLRVDSYVQGEESATVK